MVVASGSGAGGGISRPRKPKRPTNAAPSSPFVPTANISGGRVSQATRTTTPTRSTLKGTSSVSSSAKPSENILFSALANLMNRNSSTTPTMQYNQPYYPNPALRSRTSYSASTHPAINDDDVSNAGLTTPEVNYPSFGNYAEQMDRTNTYENATHAPVKVWQPEPLTPERVGPEELRKRLMRRFSRRGGHGIVNPASPIKGYEMGPGYDSDFGPRIHPIDGGARVHTGDDISEPQGTPIYAPVGGVVAKATSQGGAYGNQVVLDHGAKQQTMYGHMAEIAVAPGTKVKKGDLIGFVGSTGYSTGPHLHYETWNDGSPVDPSMQYNDNDAGVIDAAVKRRLKRNPSLSLVAETTPEESQEDSPGLFSAMGQALGPKTPEEYYESRSFWEVPEGQPVRKQQAAQQGGQLAQNPQLNALMNAIREQESGGDYDVQNGIGAMGAYQIMPSHIGPGGDGWDVDALGKEIDGQTFLNSPELQDKIAKFKLRDYFKSGGAEAAAKSWYAGPGNATLNSDAPQYGGPSVNDYADSVLRIMQKYIPRG